MHRYAISLVLAGFGLFQIADTSAQTGFCGSTVNILNTVVEVSPSGGDDTDALQCAVNEAIAQSIPRVQLSAGNFNVSRITLERLQGRLSGVSKTATTVSVIDGSTDCSTGIGIMFNVLGGDVRIERMRINAANPCAGSGAVAFIRFLPASCDEQTLFANVDRVVIEGPEEDPDSQIFAITLAPRSECSDEAPGPFGTLKVNRSEISGMDFAIFSGLRGSGQADVNFNTF